MQKKIETANNQTQQLTTLNQLLETTGLSEENKASALHPIFDFNVLPDDMMQLIKKFLSASDIKNLGSVSKSMHSLFLPPNQLLNKFLQRVAFGIQDKVEALFTDVFQSNEEKIQEALRYQSRFTDYSGRSFHCSAYEYAYWAKDTHMRRMLERYMSDETKAIMLARIVTNDSFGLTYQQNGIKHNSPHFDFTELKTALKVYIDNAYGWYAANNMAAIEAAWMDVGKVQRNVPAHVAHEYCRPDQSFYPCPQFNESKLPRVLTFHNMTTTNNHSWFPLTSSNSGLGFEFGLIRHLCKGATPGRWESIRAGRPRADLEAINRLDIERTADLTVSRENLATPTIAPGACP
jgi:hypothetical protein